MHLKTGLSKEQQTIVFASWFGWALDGYDLVLMLFVISSVNQLFFSDNSAMSLLATFATYIIALVMRPIGGALFGNFGDKYGRKKTMMVTIVGFSIVTFATGLLPTWQTVGIVAPILLFFEICPRIIRRWRMGKWICNYHGNGSKKDARVALRICSKWIFIWICTCVSHVPFSAKYFSKR